MRDWLWTAEIILLCLVLTGCSRQEADLLLSEELVQEAGQTAETAQAAVQSPPGVFSEAEGERAPEVSAAAGSPEKTAEAPEDVLPEEIYVDVCGAVKNPGVYCLEAESRIFQAIDAAGGFLPEAAQELVNQAQNLADGMQIYVPTRAEAEEKQFSVSTGGTGEPVSAEAENKVNINTADAAALMTLTGIGESRAKDIISYRETQGGFSVIEDIMKVQGIKEGTFNRIKDEIVVE